MNWAAMMHMAFLLYEGEKWKMIVQKMADLYGIAHHNTLEIWRRRYQKRLQEKLEAEGMEIGDEGGTIVIDESLFGTWPEEAEEQEANEEVEASAGPKTLPNRSGSARRVNRGNKGGHGVKRRGRIVRKMPAQTKWTRKATIAARPAAAQA